MSKSCPLRTKNKRILFCMDENRRFYFPGKKIKTHYKNRDGKHIFVFELQPPTYIIQCPTN
jgi:hypothetical protein